MIFAFLTIAAAASSCLPVAGDKVLASDLSPAVAAFSKVPAGTVLGYSPQPGHHRVFGAGELRSLLHRYGIEAEIAADVCVAWPVAQLRSEAIRAAMERSLPDVPIDISDASHQPVPSGEILFPLAGLAAKANSDGSRLWRGSILYAADRRFDIWARVYIRGQCTEVVAAESLRAGARISAEQVRLETHEGLPCPDAMKSVGDAVGRIPRRFIAANQVVAGSALSAPKEIQKGDAVRVEVRSGGAVVSFDGSAEASGAAGDPVSVRNPITGKLVTAIVESPGRAALRLKENP